jgi:ribosomal protein S18 acetylase RimI-like enzyme
VSAPELRPATAADGPDIARIWRQGWRDGHLGHVPPELAQVRTDASFDHRATERLPLTTVATVDGGVVGFVVVVDDEAEQVYVDRAARGSGVAAVLLREAERQVEAAGYPRIWLAVAKGNARARRFYERAGWVDEGPFDYQADGPDATIPVPCRRYARTFERHKMISPGTAP